MRDGSANRLDGPATDLHSSNPFAAAFRDINASVAAMAQSPSPLPRVSRRMSAQEELHEGTSPASEEPSHRTPFRLFEDVDTTDSEGEAEPGPQHAESPAPEVTPELLATIVKQVRFVRWQATCGLEHRVPLDSSACTGGW